MADYVITTGTTNIEIEKNGITNTYSKGSFYQQLDDNDANTLDLYNINKTKIEFSIYVNSDTIDVNGTTSFANATELKNTLSNIIY